MWQIRFKSQRGAFLIGALIFVAIVGVAVIAITTLVVSQNRGQQTFIDERKAFYAAETGIEYAIGVLTDSSDWRGGVSKDSVGDGEFSVTVDDTNTISSLGDTVLVTAVGYKGKIQRTVQTYLIQPDLGYSVLAGKDIDFSKGKAVVKGNLHANNKVKIGSKYEINGKITTAPPVINMPIVDWDFFKNLAIADTQYVDGNIELAASGSPYSGVWYATGKIMMKDNNVVVNGTLAAENNIELKKNGEIITATPSNYPAILTKGSLIVDLNNAEINGLIYCGDLDIKKNNMIINGALVVTNTITNEMNNTVINFDQKYVTKVSGVDFSSNSAGPPLVIRWKVKE
jgi:hypothetical protein